MELRTETKTEHIYWSYGVPVRGYGSSMDQHRCGDEKEPCVKITYERQVSDWKVVGKEQKP